MILAITALVLAFISLTAAAGVMIRINQHMRQQP